MTHLLQTASEIDAVFRHPSVAGPLGLGPDWTGADVLRAGGRVWGFDGGAFALVPFAEDVFEVHSGVLPRSRGRVAVRAAREVIARETEAGIGLVGRTPIGRRDALHFALASGMKYVGSDGEDWITWAAR